MFFCYKKIDWVFQFFSVQPPLVMGMAYFLCKQIHFVMEVGKGKIVQVSFRKYMHYSFFLPVMFAGPINRYPHFVRQCERRRLELSNFTSSFERTLYGYSKIILGNYLIAVKLKELIRVNLPVTDTPIAMFLDSAANWMLLYAQFSGYTDIALGFALLIGIRLEENFNNPLAANNLIDFWQRWHITLSEWCKDYVFGPIQALTRNQLVAVLAAMIVMGFWHEISLYYTVWGVYQAMGIALCRVYTQLGDPFYLRIFPLSVRNGVTRTATFTWLVSGSPIITYLLSLF
jgi:alginate O-acetyltransferase complex protein AlgI